MSQLLLTGQSKTKSSEFVESCYGLLYNGEKFRRSINLDIMFFSLSNFLSLTRYAGIQVSSGNDNSSGLSLYATQALKPSDIVIQVPTKLTLSVESPVDYNTVMEKVLFESNPKAYRNAPWWAALAIQLNYYDKINPINSRARSVSMKAWMDTLPRVYDTPIHWTESFLEELQYGPIIDAVRLQKRLWREQYDALTKASVEFASKISYDDFVWGCETARR